MHPSRWIRVDFSHGKLQSVCLSNTSRSAPTELRTRPTWTDEGAGPGEYRCPGLAILCNRYDNICAGMVPGEAPLLSAQQSSQGHGRNRDLPRWRLIATPHEHL